MRRNRVFLVGWEFSRQGGIQEVSRQVAAVLGQEPFIDLSILKYPKPELLARAIRCLSKFHIREDDIYFFMHPQIFQAFQNEWQGGPRPKTMVWAHGIEAWGNFGRRLAPDLPSAQKILASSHYTRARILDNFPNSDVSVVPLTPHEEPTFHFRPTTAPFEILTISRLAGGERYKGHDMVLESLSLLKSRSMPIPYHIVGEGSDRSRLENLVAGLKLRELVTFHGFLSDRKLGGIYARCSAFVMPSYVLKKTDEIWSGEGLGLVYLEAACHGLPSIACDEGGQTDCILDGETGYLIPADPTILAQKIGQLYKNPQTCRMMGEQARRFVATNFSWNRFRNSLLGALQEVAKMAP